ncbi:hypothetical protein CVT26_004754, partial [Gymnopilus dilepis]
MEVGGLTQFQSRVQTMPKEIEKSLSRQISKFMWTDQTPMVNREIMSSRIDFGGKKVMDMEARNEAIELMKMRAYLSHGQDRPRWAYLADILIARNLPKDQEKIPMELRQNIYLQTWTTKTSASSRLPQSLRAMLKVAKKYNVDFNPPALTQDAKSQLQVWYHKGLDVEKRPQNNSKWAKCQRNNHNIYTVGDMTAYVTTALPHRHNGRRNCACYPCKAARELKCEHPHKCREAARAFLDAIHRKWDPRSDDQASTMRLTQDQLEQNMNANLKRDKIFFDPMIPTCAKIDDEFRVFVNPENLRNEPPLRGGRAGMQNRAETVVIYGIQGDKSIEDAPGYGSIWFSHDSPRNTRYRCSKTSPQLQDIEAEGILRLLREAPKNVDLHILLRSENLIRTLTKNLPKLEERGWIGIPNRQVLQSVVRELRKRTGYTALQCINDADNSTRVRRARDLAEDTSIRAENDEIPLTASPEFAVNGLRLKTATQSLLYEGIMETKHQEIRRPTLINLDITRHAVKEHFTGSFPSDSEIWKSIRSKNFSQKARAFLWKAMHNAYRIGSYWRHIPNYEQRQDCHVCGTEDNMSHILTECRASGQEVIWQLTEELWKKRGLPWSKPTLGMILGCGLASFRATDRRKKILHGANRLFAILVSESAHLAWKISRTFKVEHDSNPDKIR